MLTLLNCIVICDCEPEAVIESQRLDGVLTHEAWQAANDVNAPNPVPGS